MKLQFCIYANVDTCEMYKLWENGVSRAPMNVTKHTRENGKFRIFKLLVESFVRENGSTVIDSDDESLRLFVGIRSKRVL